MVRREPAGNWFTRNGARDLAIAEAVAKGAKRKQVASQYGVTVRRVDAIIKKVATGQNRVPGDLSARAERALQWIGVNDYRRDLPEAWWVTVDSFEGMPNCGRGTISEIDAWLLNRCGRSLLARALADAA